MAILTILTHPLDTPTVVAGNMDAGGFYLSKNPFPSSLFPHNTYPPPGLLRPSVPVASSQVTNGIDSSNQTAFTVGLSQKLDLLLTTFEEHKTSLSSTIEHLKTEVTSLKSELTSVKEEFSNYQSTSTGKKTKWKKTCA